MNDRYDITRLITKDHAGGLYEGEDTLLNRKVSCRRFFGIDGDCDISKWSDQFTEYCHKLTAINHPNLALVYDAGIDEDGAFLISQLIKGERLDKLLVNHPFSEYEIYSLANDILDAFATLHSVGDTHGALSPASIVRTDKTGGRFTHHITDQGIADLIPIIQGQPYDSKNPALTAPEQLRSHEATPQSDLFMLGQLCYSLAAQGHPFSEASIEEAIQLHEAGGQQNLAGLAPQLSQPMVNWIHSLCAADLVTRPSSAELAIKSLPQVRPTPTATAPTTQQITPSTAPQQQTPQTATSAVSTPGGIVFQAAQPVTSPVVLASHKKSNKGLIITICCAVLLVGVVGIIVASQDSPPKVTDSTDSTDNKATPKVNKKASAQISASRPVAYRFAPAGTTIQTIDLTTESYDDVAVMTEVDPALFKSPTRCKYLTNVSKTSNASFKNNRVSSQPIQYKTTGGTFTPLSAANVFTGKGWNIDLYTPSNVTGGLEIGLYLLQFDRDLKIEIIERSGRIDTEVQLASKTTKPGEWGVYLSNITIKDVKPDCYYTIRVLQGDKRTDKAAKFDLIGISALTVKKSK